MTDAELLAAVKTWLSNPGYYNDNTLLMRIKGIKQSMLELDIPVERVESDLGIIALAIGVQDLWNLSPGEVVHSPAFMDYYIPKLKPGF